MHHVPVALQCIYGRSDVIKIGMGRRGVKFQEEGRERRLLGLLYADHLVFCGELEEDLRAIVGRFIEVCRRSLKVNAGKGKVMLLDEEEGLEFEVCVNGYVQRYLGI